MVDKGGGSPAGASASASKSASGSPSAPNDVEPALAETSAAGIDADHDWTLMVRMAEDISWDDAEGPSLDVRPAAVDRALIELTAEERDRLLQLVRDDLARQKSS